MNETLVKIRVRDGSAARVLGHALEDKLHAGSTRGYLVRYASRVRYGPQCPRKRFRACQDDLTPTKTPPRSPASLQGGYPLAERFKSPQSTGICEKHSDLSRVGRYHAI